TAGTACPSASPRPAPAADRRRGRHGRRVRGGPGGGALSLGAREGGAEPLFACPRRTRAGTTPGRDDHGDMQRRRPASGGLLSRGDRRLRRVFREGASRGPWRSPATLFLLLFATVDFIGATLLTLPAAHAEGHGLGFVEALFTSTSALSVCGLAVIDLGADLSLFGQTVVMALIQVGGIGIMSLAWLLGVAGRHRSGRRLRLALQEETRIMQVGDVRGLVRRLILVSLGCEAPLPALRAPPLWLVHGEDLPDALYLAVFHAVSA